MKPGPPNKSSSYRARATWRGAAASTGTRSNGMASYLQNPPLTPPKSSGSALNSTGRRASESSDWSPAPSEDSDQGVGSGDAPVREYGEAREGGGARRRRNKGGAVVPRESDTSSQEDVESYKENMETLICNVRADLNLPSLPLIQVAIASGDAKYLEKIREIQKGIDLPNVVCVDAKGLQLKEDNLHLTTEAQVLLGRMLADAYLTHFLC
ncbi:UNVERIFIED_CONTAM: putative carbohydrate esterase [Sesamum calycinum]|uniref:Carbohydrate esterase n=1 Tax=Sesamum calycinum TaxID=2727403 RepID=A0AAW2R782_9LAMI